MTRREGLTLVEVVIVMLTLGILAGIAAPRLVQAIHQADASKVVSDARTVELAVRSYYEETGRIPDRGRWGETPADLSDYLDLPFSYKNLDYRLILRRNRGLVVLRIRYPRNDPLGAELARFRRDDGTVTWNRRRTDFSFEVP